MKRIQCKRSRGWRKPAGAIFVGKSSQWGNPYDVRTYGRDQAVKLFRQYVERMLEAEREAWLAPLHQATALMCWCPLDKLCHADVLIEYLAEG